MPRPILLPDEHYGQLSSTDAQIPFSKPFAFLCFLIPVARCCRTVWCEKYMMYLWAEDARKGPEIWRQVALAVCSTVVGLLWVHPHFDRLLSETSSTRSEKKIIIFAELHWVGISDYTRLSVAVNGGSGRGGSCCGRSVVDFGGGR